MATKQSTKTKTLKDAKRAAVVSELASKSLLGEIVTWNANGPYAYQDVVDALSAAGLDPTVAKQFLPRHAFTRVVRKLANEKAIDVVNETTERVTFQFTAKSMDNDEWKYSKEANVVLHKETGTITCDDDHELQKFTQEQLNKAIDARTSSDISRIVQQLFDNHDADLWPVRDQGGVYFVPREHVDFTARVEKFLSKLGGSLRRIPVPAGTDTGDRAIQETLADGFNQLIKEHEEAVAGFTVHSRGDAIERAANRIKETRVKIEAYANYLQDKSEALLKAVDDAKKKLAAQVAVITKQKEENPELTQRSELVGHSVTSVLRWMGANGWTLEQAREALKRHNIEVAEVTLTSQFRGGQLGKRGEPAQLTKEQIAELSGEKSAKSTAKKTAKKAG